MLPYAKSLTTYFPGDTRCVAAQKAREMFAYPLSDLRERNISARTGLNAMGWQEPSLISDRGSAKRAFAQIRQVWLGAVLAPFITRVPLRAGYRTGSQPERGYTTCACDEDFVNSNMAYLPSWQCDGMVLSQADRARLDELGGDVSIDRYVSRFSGVLSAPTEFPAGIEHHRCDQTFLVHHPRWQSVATASKPAGRELPSYSTCSTVSLSHRHQRSPDIAGRRPGRR